MGLPGRSRRRSRGTETRVTLWELTVVDRCVKMLPTPRAFRVTGAESMWKLRVVDAARTDWVLVAQVQTWEALMAAWRLLDPPSASIGVPYPAREVSP